MPTVGFSALVRGSNRDYHPRPAGVRYRSRRRGRSRGPLKSYSRARRPGRHAASRHLLGGARSQRGIEVTHLAVRPSVVAPKQADWRFQRVAWQETPSRGRMHRGYIARRDAVDPVLNHMEGPAALGRRPRSSWGCSPAPWHDPQLSRNHHDHQRVALLDLNNPSGRRVRSRRPGSQRRRRLPLPASSAPHIQE
jgi:hypothetical protein